MNPLPQTPSLSCVLRLRRHPGPAPDHHHATPTARLGRGVGAQAGCAKRRTAVSLGEGTRDALIEGAQKALDCESGSARRPRGPGPPVRLRALANGRV